MANIVYNPSVPFGQKLIQNVEVGKTFSISGIPFKDPIRMTINLSNGDEILLHFDVRFNYYNEKNSIVRNHLTDCWNREERGFEGEFPFPGDKFFNMIITVESACFKVTVNNQPVLEFAHRVPFHLINELSVTGDVRLCEVRF